MYHAPMTDHHVMAQQPGRECPECPAFLPFVRGRGCVLCAVRGPLTLGISRESPVQAPFWGSLAPSIRVAPYVDHVSRAGQCENPTPKIDPSCENPLN